MGDLCNHRSRHSAHSLIAVIYQVMKAAMANPIDALRDE
jgi:hypothetical protein